MTDDATKIRSLLFRSVRALAGLLMDVQLNAREFVELCKLAFVDAAIRKSPDRASVARIVERTGLSKHEVRRLREKLEQNELDQIVMPRSESLILQRWYTDPDLLGPDGQPAPLSRWPGKGSLRAMVSELIGDGAADEAIEDLLRYGHVVEGDAGTLKPVARGALAPRSSVGLFSLLRSSLLPVCLAIQHNLSPSSGELRWLQRTAYARGLPADKLHRVRQGIRDRGAHLIREADDFMGAFTERVGNIDDEATLVGLCVIYFEDDGR